MGKQQGREQNSRKKNYLEKGLKKEGGWNNVNSWNRRPAQQSTEVKEGKKQRAYIIQKYDNEIIAPEKVRSDRRLTWKAHTTQKPDFVIILIGKTSLVS